MYNNNKSSSIQKSMMTRGAVMIILVSILTIILIITTTTKLFVDGLTIFPSTVITRRRVVPPKRWISKFTYNSITASSQMHISSSSSRSTIKEKINTLYAIKKQKRSTLVGEDLKSQSPLEPVGTQFFGGAAQKEELFDTESETRADEIVRQIRQEREKDRSNISYCKFDDIMAYPDEFARLVAKRLQAQINSVLYEEDEVEEEVDNGEQEVADALFDADRSKLQLYNDNSKNFQWETPFSKSKTSRTPLDELRKSLDFYRRVDVAIIGARSTTSSDDQAVVEIQWIMSLVWPNAWEARLSLSGTSTITLDQKGTIITRQVDRLDNGGDIVSAISSQVGPRFWDVYHIGMTPSAEQMQRLSLPKGKTKGFLAKYNVFEIAPRLVLRPTMLDWGGREFRLAQSLPDHAFSCIIKTVGPQKQRYVPASPLEVAIKSTGEDGERETRITWTVPIPAELASQFDLPLPIVDSNFNHFKKDAEASSSYEYQPRRRVATISFNGNPQDEGVAKARRDLYDAVKKDGFLPKMDDVGNPCFFYLQNEAKLCFTEDGLGMAIYEARPGFLVTDDVGIELYCD